MEKEWFWYYKENKASGCRFEVPWMFERCEERAEYLWTIPSFLNSIELDYS